EGNQLRLRSRSVGFTASDSGFGRNFVFLAVPDPATVTEVKVTVTPTDLSVGGCSGNVQPTQSFAGFIGSFFNSATPTNGSQTNDVVADIGVFQDSTSKSPNVVYALLECKNLDCTQFNVLDSVGEDRARSTDHGGDQVGRGEPPVHHP